MDMKKLEKSIDLPLELLIEILSCLPVKPLLRFKCVSKSLYNVINSPDFIKLHLSRSLQAHLEGTLIVFGYICIHTFDYSDSPCHATKLYYPDNDNYLRMLVGSCNGLLCFSCQADEVALLNPATRACKNLPKITLTNMYRELRTPLGFGYDCISDDYKILRCARLRVAYAGIPEWETFLYSYKTNVWESIQNPPWTWETVILSPGSVVNNSLHWMDRDHKVIKCFDLFTQRYYEVPLHEKIIPGYSPTLCVLRGQLCVVTFYLDIWVLKEYGVQDSWTRVFRCPSVQWNSLYNSFCRMHLGLSVACSKDGSKILLAVMGDRQNFICCDLKSKEATKIQIPGLPPRSPAILQWVESLVPLSDDVMNYSEGRLEKLCDIEGKLIADTCIWAVSLET
ncbi:F-box protein CPR30-like [Chenopodium quinoa]|uniref:F-box protein CPR30-like n=1 Tax=Chenopodium quinoa TaxID=63459 RepID=UPI000B7719A9|nr:F-box protein CPR30-like [Chenopodium quinoa]XP_021719795.1 F-box protein CPR30-like [Chenopodium quinoa]